MKTNQNKDEEIVKFLKLMSEHNIDIEKVKKYFLQQDNIKKKNDGEGFHFPRRY